MRCDPAVPPVAPLARAEQHDRRQRDPSTDRVHDDRAGEVVERRAEGRRDPVLEAEPVVPGHALEDRVDDAHDRDGRGQLRIELRALGNAARDDRGHRRREGQQEKELGEFIAALLHQGFRAGEEAGAVGDAVADEEVRQGRHREVREDLHQRVDLVLAADGPELEKGEAGVHGKHHDGAEQNEQHVCR